MKPTLLFIAIILSLVLAGKMMESCARKKPEYTPEQKQELLKQHEEKVNELQRLRREYKESIEIYRKYRKGEIRLA